MSLCSSAGLVQFGSDRTVMKRLGDFSPRLDSSTWSITFGVNSCSFLLFSCFFFFHWLSPVTLPRRKHFYKRQRKCLTSWVLIFFLFLFFFDFLICWVFKFLCRQIYSSPNKKWTFRVFFCFCHSFSCPFLFVCSQSHNPDPAIPIHVEIRFLQFHSKPHIYHSCRKESQENQAFISIPARRCFGFLCAFMFINPLGLFQLEKW